MSKPYYIEFPYSDPAVLFAPHAGKPFAQFLDSSMHETKQGRYSFIVLDPVETFSDPTTCFSDLKNLLKDNQVDPIDGLPPFQGGLLGYFSYELLHQIEKLAEKEKDHFSVPDLALGFYDVVAAFDHHTQKSWIISLHGEQRATWLQEMLQEGVKPHFEPPLPKLNWVSDFNRAAYEEAVQKIIDYIYAGDIFQANMTQRFQADLPHGFKAYQFYQRLRTVNPAPFSAFLNFDDFAIASSSPERFLKLENQQVETCPIKGTRPRNSDTNRDAEIVQELKNSEKDRAENTMIVDLLRNDISKVCQPNSVEVPELCDVHSFASVHHLISTVTGVLEDDKNAIDLLQACFPGGSITGAPKVRAMEIISELEPCRRGPYCGAIGYLGLNGNMDTNIVIRTALFKGNKVCAQAGGGIVADSIPKDEYQESLDKADALFRAFTN